MDWIQCPFFQYVFQYWPTWFRYVLRHAPPANFLYRFRGRDAWKFLLASLLAVLLASYWPRYWPAFGQQWFTPNHKQIRNIAQPFGCGIFHVYHPPPQIFEVALCGSSYWKLYARTRAEQTCYNTLTPNTILLIKLMHKSKHEWKQLQLTGISKHQSCFWNNCGSLDALSHTIAIRIN